MISTKLAFVLVLASVMIGASYAHSDETLTSSQLDALIFHTEQITSCGTYSLNYGENHPYEEACVNRLVESASRLFAAFIPKPNRVVRDIESIRRCGTYSLNYGKNHPYEEVCVNRLVENVLADLQDMKNGK